MPAARWPSLAAIALVLLASLRIVSTYSVFNATIDEPDNLAAGLEYLTTGRYLYHDENPPLARVFEALGPRLAGERYRGGPAAYLEGARTLGAGVHYDCILALSRAGVLPFFWAASLVVFLWGRRAGGPAAALFATALFTSLPPVLALSGIANTDMALCATVPAAALLSVDWARDPRRRRSVLLGLAIAAACLSKFTAIPFLAASWIAMAIVARQAPRALWERRRAVALVLGVAALAIWAAYGFSFARVEFLHARLPAPRFFTGLEKVWAHQHRGHWSYLLGRQSESGFWYYFPVVLALKLPIAFLILSTAGAALLFRRKQPVWAALAAASSAAIVIAAMAARVDIGVRYVLPATAGLSVVAGWAAAQARSARSRLAVAALLAWHLVSGALHHPDYLAYTNELAGARPERFLADSDLDWGQDMKRLAAFLQQQHAERIAFDRFELRYPMPVEVVPASPAGLVPGWNAASITMWKVFGDPAWVDRAPPPVRIGRGILVWRAGPGAAQ
jgi:hypothetical protein